MRVSTTGMSSRLLEQIATSQRRLFEVQERIASGRRINRPSDDPFGTSRLMDTRTKLELSTQYQRNIAVAESELAVTEAAFTHFTALIQRAEELSIAAGSTTLDPKDRAIIAEEVSSLVTEAIGIANTNYGGRYLFGGHQTGAPPFDGNHPDLPAAVAYLGDTGAIAREIARGETVAVNVTGDRLAGIFERLIDFRDHLQSNNVDELRHDSERLRGELESVLQLRSEIGSKVRRIEVAQVRLADEEVLLRMNIAKLEEADLAESIVDLQMRETAFQAALSATSRSLNLSLVNFLR